MPSTRDVWCSAGVPCQQLMLVAGVACTLEPGQQPPRRVAIVARPRRGWLQRCHRHENVNHHVASTVFALCPIKGGRVPKSECNANNKRKRTNRCVNGMRLAADAANVHFRQCSLVCEQTDHTSSFAKDGRMQCKDGKETVTRTVTSRALSSHPFARAPQAKKFSENPASQTHLSSE